MAGEADFLDSLGGPSLELPGGPERYVPTPVPEEPKTREQILMDALGVGVSMVPSMGGARAAEGLATRLFRDPNRVVQVGSRMLGAGAGEVGGRSGLEAYQGTPAGERESMLRKFATGAAGEGVGAAVEDVGRTVGRAAAPYLEGAKGRLGSLANKARVLAGADPERLALPDQGEAISAAQDYLRGHGASLTADQALPESAAMQRIGGFVGQTGPVSRTHAQSEKVGAAAVQNFVKLAGAKDPRLLGEVAQLAIENSTRAHRMASRAKWDALEHQLAGVGSSVSVDVSPLWKAGGEELERAGLPFRPGLRRMAKLIGQEGTDVQVQGVQTVPSGLYGPKGEALTKQVPTTFTQRMPKLSFEEAQDLRAALGEAANSREVLPGVNPGFAKHLKGILDEQIDKAEGQLAAMGRQDIVDLYGEAKDITRMGHTRFNNNVVRGWLGNIEPEKVYEGFVRNGSPTRVKMMRSIYEEAIDRGAIPKDSWLDVQSRYFDDVLSSSVGERGIPNGKALVDNLDKLGKEATEELFPGPEGYRTVDEFRKRARVLEIAQHGSTAGGQMSVNIMQSKAGFYALLAGGVGGGYAAGGARGGAAVGAPAAVVLLGPRALGHIFSDKVFVKHLTDGWLTEAGTIASSRVIGRLLLRAAELKEQGVPDIEVNREMLNRVDFKTGELTPTVGEVAVANRPYRPMAEQPTSPGLGLDLKAPEREQLLQSYRR